MVGVKKILYLFEYKEFSCLWVKITQMWGLFLQFFLIKYCNLLKNNILIFYCWLAEFLQCVMCGNTRQMAAAAAQAGCYHLATVQALMHF
ncbi:MULTISPECIES: hypothetical protein [Pseudomonas]|uniref:hypothetical protein n=1 Tax=Pseudomonas TaxID=286 RepID=UPI002DB9D72A|nr:hypothetical protein [Pseudomonas asiatica]MEB6589703.1 hypothetical protein [Pseudomonas asiatica]